MLAGIFTRVLQINTVGSEDNYFELGGDSLSALEVIFTAEKAGLHITLEALRSGTIRTLAAQTAAIKESKPGVIFAQQNDGIPLTPSQHWLLDRNFENPASYAFSAWLRSDQSINMEVLSQAWQAVVDHHDALRIHFDKNGDRIRQIVEAAGTSTQLEFKDLRQLSQLRLTEEIDASAQTLVTNAELFNTPLPRLLCLHVPDNRDLLFIFIPHIITDEYSARIIIDDLATVYGAIQRGNAVQLPVATTSFSQWASQLQNFARNSEVRYQVDALCRLPWQQYQQLPRDIAHGSNTYAQASDLRLVLSEADTEQLLQLGCLTQIPVASVFAGALAQVVGLWAGTEYVLMDMTTAGRDLLFESGPLHHSVGYFSTIHPVLLKSTTEWPNIEAIRQVDVCLRSAAGRGALYGLMRYLNPEAAMRQRLGSLPTAEIKFNYPGLQPLCQDGGPFHPAGISAPNALKPTDIRQYLLNLEIMYYQKQFVTAWKYPAGIYRKETIEELAQGYLDNLRGCTATSLVLMNPL